MVKIKQRDENFHRIFRKRWFSNLNSIFSLPDFMTSVTQEFWKSETVLSHRPVHQKVVFTNKVDICQPAIDAWRIWSISSQTATAPGF